MSVLDDLRRLSAAEEFFAYLEVDFDPRIVRVARLHILRRMGEHLAKDALESIPEDEVRARCRAHLESAYLDFVRRSPIEERVFKVHRDAAAPARPAAFVSISALKGKH